MLDKPKPTLAPIPPPDVRPAPSPTRVTTPAILDRMLHAWQSRFTGGRSPSTVGLAFLDWAAHAANAPFQTAELGRTALAQWHRLAHAAMGGGKRDRAAAGRPPLRPSGVAAASLTTCSPRRCCSARNGGTASCAVPRGVDPHNERMVAFTVRQWLDLMSPSNVPWLNPEVIEATRNTGGAQPRGRDAQLPARSSGGARRRGHQRLHGRRATSPPRPARSCSAMR